MIFQEEQLQIKYYVIKLFNIAKNPKYDGYQKGLASMVYKFFDKKSAKGSASTFANQFASKSAIEQLAEELHKSVIENS